MVDKDVVFEKINQIQNCLQRIHQKTKDDPLTLMDVDVQDIFVLNLQRAVQSCVDLAAHVIADEGLGLPRELRENFSILEKSKIIDPVLSQKLQKMVGFRNIAVHEYEAIDKNVLQSILTQGHLKDIEAFYSAIIRHFHLNK